MAGSDWSIPLDRDPLDDSMVSAEVADHRMLRGPVVPEPQVPARPVVSDDEFRAHRMPRTGTKGARRSRGG